MVDKITDLLKSAADTSKMTSEEVEYLRVELATARAIAVQEVFVPATNKLLAAELKAGHLEGTYFVKYFKAYLDLDMTNEEGQPILDGRGKTKKYSATVAESMARKGIHVEGTPYYKAKAEYQAAKDFVSQLYQLFKAVDQVTNSLAAITK